MKLDKHYTATTYILHKFEPKTLLHFHKKLQTWLPPGGHIEVNETPLEAAVREIVEETAIDSEHLEFVPNGEEPYQIDERVEMLAMPHYLLSELIEEGHYHLDWIFYAKVDPKNFNNNLPDADFLWFSMKDLEDETEIFANVRELAKKGLKNFASFS